MPRKKVFSRPVFKKAFVATLPVLAGYGVLGAAFGMLMSASGFVPAWSAGMSAFVYAGSLQFASVGLLTGGASLFMAALTAFSVNARHIVYGFSMAEKYAAAGKKKPYLILALTDETFSLVSAEHGLSRDEELTFCFYVTLLDHAYWVIASTAGAILGTLLPSFPAGLDFALTALFVSAAADKTRAGKTGLLSVLVGMFSALVCLILFGKDAFLIPALVLMMALLVILPEEKHDER